MDAVNICRMTDIAGREIEMHHHSETDAQLQFDVDHDSTILKK